VYELDGCLLPLPLLPCPEVRRERGCRIVRLAMVQWTSCKTEAFDSCLACRRDLRRKSESDRRQPRDTQEKQSRSLSRLAGASRSEACDPLHSSRTVMVHARVSCAHRCNRDRRHDLLYLVPRCDDNTGSAAPDVYIVRRSVGMRYKWRKKLCCDARHDARWSSGRARVRHEIWRDDRGLGVRQMRRRSI
jgi:hypothetical protein